MRWVTVQRAAGTRERVAWVTAPVVIDLTDPRPRVVDEEFVVEWQISDPGRQGAEDERVAPLRT
jgi:hypothetical protein